MRQEKMNAMKEDVGRLLLGAWVLVMVVCFLGVENIQAKEPSMDKVELTTELELDVRGQVDAQAGMDSIALYFEGIRGQQQEKLWLHLNQPYYAAGDTIWFRAYLLDAMTHRQDTLSNFIYVDLFDRAKRLVASRKIKRDSLGFANCLPLPDTLAAGEYTLRANTGWMLNFDLDGFFQKNISIGQELSQVNHSVVYTDKRMIVRFSDLRRRPLAKKEVLLELYDKDGNHLSEGWQTSSSTGAIFIPIPADSIIKGAYADIRFSISEDSVFRRTVFVEPPAKETFDIQFLPEGGELIAGIPQRVAFKAVRSNGDPAEVHGFLLNNRNDTVARFHSEHNGMGSFALSAQSGEQYRAETFCDTLAVSTSLPAVKEHACALQVVCRDQDIRYRILGELPQGAILVGHMRGICNILTPIDPKQNAGIIKTDSLQEEILHLLLVDNFGHPRTERLIYIHKPGQTPLVSALADKPEYAARERVRVDLSLSQDGKPLSGYFSVCVTDAHAVKADSLEENIRSYLLLSSDLKGYIHDPEYYFLDDSPLRLYHLDLVMMTHGWRRFPTDNLFRPAPFAPKFFLEHGQFFSGQVNNMVGKGVKEATLTAFVVRGEGTNDKAFTTMTDSTGHFLFEGLDFQDTTVFMIPFYNKKGRIPYDIQFDKSYYRPRLSPTAPYKKQVQQVEQADEAVLQMYKKSSFGALREYSMEAFTVHAKDPDAPAVRIEQKTHKDTAKFNEFNTLPLPLYLNNVLPGCKIVYDKLKGGQIFLENGYGVYKQAQLRINNEVCFSTAPLSLYTAEDIEYIKTYIPSIGSSYCCIDIRMKEDAQGARRFGLYKTVGYIPGTEFYHPVYDTSEKRESKTPDHRTTLYWEPYLQVGPDGKGNLEFYTNDNKKSELEITIEGITAEGVPLFHRTGIVKSRE